MKIVHITENYFEGWGYQENLLPLYQKRAGHDVAVVSDNDHLKYSQNPSLIQATLERGTEYEYEGMRIYKIKTYFNTSSTSFFCKGLYRILEQESPDMIFHHNVNTSTLTIASRYKQRHPMVKLYVDNHVDWINESKNKLWHRFFYDMVIPAQVKRVSRSVDAFIGVSPLRCQYLNKVYKAPMEKIKFLPIGCDTYQAEQITGSRDELRQQYGIDAASFVVVSGGKIDRSKGTMELIAACDALRKSGEDVRLVLFGKIDEEVAAAATGKDWIVQKGWCDRMTTLSLLKMADVACWPWLHTTLIEDSVAVGTPLVVKMSDNVSHFAKEKAGVFMIKGDVKELECGMMTIKSDAAIYQENVQKACDKYSYSTLIKRLEDESFCEL